MDMTQRLDLEWGKLLDVLGGRLGSFTPEQERLARWLWAQGIGLGAALEAEAPGTVQEAAAAVAAQELVHAR